MWALSTEMALQLADDAPEWVTAVFAAMFATEAPEAAASELA